ncbi:hypothetical protein CSQ85_09275 [Bifidobacterium rousetti]|uniref:hypothetical protein n=1 Tax=Bifidobacterium rousetti TaxID=2045439 RepID=UPI00123ABF55|nr:hypothetical protein [Bifidobacterium rousetti]KAA8818342.1 hypothetical protein CSQ85_09275 [Bifidobacterium rousetti]
MSKLNLQWTDRPSRAFELDATTLEYPATLKRRRGGHVTVATYDTGHGVQSAAFASETDARAWIHGLIIQQANAQHDARIHDLLDTIEDLADGLDRLAPMADQPDMHDAYDTLRDAFDQLLATLPDRPDNIAWSTVTYDPLTITTIDGQTFTSWRDYLHPTLDSKGNR